jgi:PAS domain S-box-containing protein
MNGLGGIPASYDYRLVALSALISIFASYAALDLAGRVTATRGHARLAWLFGGAAAMGSGIWAMHYVGMLAFRLPIPVYYDVPTVLLSLLAGIMAALVVLWVVSRPRMSGAHVLAGSLLMGTGIATMHYTGMAAMRLAAMHHYHRGLWLLSVVLAVVISYVALWLTARFRDENRGWKQKTASSVVMGLAIPVMHYTGMAAVHFMPMNVAPDLADAVDISTLANFAIVFVTFVILGFALLTSTVDRHLSAQRSELESKHKILHALIDNIPDFMYVKDPQGSFVVANLHLAHTVGVETPEELLGKTDFDFYPRELATAYYEDEQNVMRSGQSQFNREETGVDRQGQPIHRLMTRVPLRDKEGRVTGVAGVGRDISDRQKVERERDMMEVQLRHSQKLESIGQLAAGIAHEINTPTQYIGDNVRFLKDAFQDLGSLLAEYERLLATVKSGAVTHEAVEAISAAVDRVDAAYLLDEIPKAAQQALEGVTRVATLVSAMKEFSHPGGKEKAPTDLNRAIESTITVSRNEWKYVAETETDFDPSLPLISCLASEFNQVILNLIVNAAHTIADARGRSPIEKGKITVRTRNCPDWVEIRIQDTGLGIPLKVRDRIFDPFFTTKEVGKGTGQGLAIARSVVVDKHGGSIHFETEEGKGTTFVIRLPHDGKTLSTKLVVA